MSARVLFLVVCVLVRRGGRSGSVIVANAQAEQPEKRSIDRETSRERERVCERDREREGESNFTAVGLEPTQLALMEFGSANCPVRTCR